MLQVLKEFQVGRPQVLAGLMLLAFLAQALWMAQGRKLSSLEFQYIEAGLPQRSGQEYRVTSPLTSWVGAFPFRLARYAAGGAMSQAGFVPRPWMPRLPFMMFGAWLGAALWWVARRLFDDAGGYVALGLYCSSPAMVMIASNVGPEIILAWSIFGMIYTAIGVAHTLYAPARKWLPRIVILGLSIGFALATALWSFTLALLALAVMLYLAPGRRLAALGVWVGASGIGAAVFATVSWLTRGWTLGPHNLLDPKLSSQMLETLNFVFADGYLPINSYLFVLFFIVALTAYGSWARARYFGNTAPLVTGFATVLLFSLVPAVHLWDATLGLSFVFLFVGGVAADLLETGWGRGVARILGAGFLLRAVLGIVALGRWINVRV
jgi:Dolichyl-phosphate-mannose-protein mannosyltransferase